jgi:hypothetical protein
MVRSVTGMGRPSIFPDKYSGRRIQASISKVGSVAFERHRQDLASLYARIMGRSLSSVSDGDVVEYLSIGTVKATAYLRQLKKETA